MKLKFPGFDDSKPDPHITGWESFVKSAVKALKDRDYRDLCRAIAESFGFSRVLLATVDRRKGIVTARAGFDPTIGRPIYEALLRLYRVPLEPDERGRFSVAAWSLREQKQIHIEDASDTSLLPDEIVQRTLLVKAMGTDEYVLTPIVCAGESVALLAVDKKGQAARISPNDLARLRTVAAWLQLVFEPRQYPQLELAESSPATRLTVPGLAEVPDSADMGLFGSVLESLRDAIVVVDEDRVLRYTNKAFSHLTSIPRSQLVGRTVDSLQSTGENPRISKLLRSLDRPGERVELPGGGGYTLTVQIESFPLASSSDLSARAYLIEDVSGRVELERMREEFIEMLVHDLKAPIQGIQGFTELLRLGRLGTVTKEQVDFLERIEENARQVLSRVAQILEVTELEARKVHVRQDPVDISRVIDSVAKKLSGKALNQQVEVEVDVGPDLPTLIGDPVWLGEVFQNLLDNAIEAVAPGGAVRMSGRVIHDDGNPWIEVEVADDGPGLKPEEAARLFDELWTKPGGHRGGEGGHGLGLLIARLIVELHGGRIRANAGVDSGTSITVRLPGSRNTPTSHSTDVG